ncbi:MAG: HAD-IA family hydrolase [Treponema sp.]|jgi:putative hydrolase of the HAD superfamily|nr:HAD-IA family hydrolase [Treponema sp.]
MIQYILFDLDNTLYSAQYGLEDKVQNRIREYIARYLGTSIEDGWRQRKEKTVQYGTALEWLTVEKGLKDPEDYLTAIHPENEADDLKADPALREFLKSLPVPLAILTNSPMEHAELFLGKLGIRDLFTHIFDIRFNNLKGKPRPDTFYRALGILGFPAEQVLFIDDYPHYITGYHELGGKGLLLDEFDKHPDFPLPRIKNLRQLVEYLE